MLADEVTHVKMGSDWLRRLTRTTPSVARQALEFQAIVDKLFAIGGFRSESEESPIGLARRFRELAGLHDAEIDEIARLSEEALHEADSKRREVREQAQAAVATS